MIRELGRIKWFGTWNSHTDRNNDYGFIESIKPDNPDVFVHKTQLDCAPEDLQEGTLVAFEIRTNPKNGKPQAQFVRLLKDETGPETIAACFQSSDRDLWWPVTDAFISSFPVEQVVEAIAQKLSALRSAEDSQVLADYSTFVQTLPFSHKMHPKIFSLLPLSAQVDVATHEQAATESIWPYMQRSVKLFSVLYAAKENVTIAVDQLAETDPVVKYALLILWAKAHPARAPEAFDKAHDLFQNYVISDAWGSPEPLEFAPLLPGCEPQEVTHCEGKPWKQDVFCPRRRKRCSDARIYPDLDLPWQKWTLLELISASEMMPRIDGLRSPGEYVPKLSGWINRLNEIRERLKCSKCGQIMRPNYTYSKKLAAYNMTVVSCASGTGHDTNIYLNHCWGCEGIIDSRDNPFQVAEYAIGTQEQAAYAVVVSRVFHDGSTPLTKWYIKSETSNNLEPLSNPPSLRAHPTGYYLCPQCGSGPQQSFEYVCGDICPKCGAENMKKLDDRNFICRVCNHRILTPYKPQSYEPDFDWEEAPWQGEETPWQEF